MEKTLVELLKKPSFESMENITLKKPLMMLEHEFALYHIKEVTYDEDSPRKEAFENVLSSLSIEGIIFVYLLLGDESGVSFLFGIAKDKRFKDEISIEVDEIAETILKPALEGNFRGSVVEKLIKSERKEVRKKLENFEKVAKLQGVPSVHEDNEEFQGVDRLVDIMNGDDFCLAVMADPLSLVEINEIENRLYEIYDELQPLAKTSIQTGENESITSGESEGSSITSTTSENDSINISKNTGKSVSITQNTNTTVDGKTSSKGVSECDHNKHQTGSESRTKGTSTSDAVGKNTGTNNSTQKGTSLSKTHEYSDKQTQEWLSYTDEVLLKRVKSGKNKGLYLSSIYLFANAKTNLLKLGNTARAIFSGDEMNKSPLTFKEVTNSHEVNSVKHFQFPALQYSKEDEFKSLQQLDLLMSRSPFNKYLCNWLSTRELSVVAGLPQKEVVGLTLKEEVEFGLNTAKAIEKEHQLYIGDLVKSGLPQGIDVNIDKRDLDKHIFIAGVTGSGKTTTCHRLLESAQMPFMVIEPAKTEYRVLTKNNKDILIFTLGNDNVAPFKLNPFEFFPHENITSRVDMIKASIESAFDMEAAIPQLIEAAIYRCYEEKGWNVVTSKNSHYQDPFGDGVYAFPTLTDLMKMTETVVSEQGFDDRLKQDYIGSIKARLQGLLIGAKGQMLDTARSVDFKELALRSVILELEEIRNPSEKSLIMGFILANLNEAIRANYEVFKANGEKFRHITLIEEAHRLLSKFEHGDSQNKKQGVEAFSDMLAEVRKYGESLVIVDQIPNKLTPEVLKNTNTKIIHKLFAKDDKEAVGNTMALSEEQMGFLSNLEPGRVILSSTGMNKPLQVQVKELISTTNEPEVSAQEISDRIFDYYAQNYKKGLIKGLEFFDKKPDANIVRKIYLGEIEAQWYLTVKSKKVTLQLIDFIEEFGPTFISNFILKNCYFKSTKEDFERIKSEITCFINDLKSDANVRIGLQMFQAFRKNIKSKV